MAYGGIPEAVSRFLDLAREAERIHDSAADWETKYDLVFSDAISGEIQQTGISVDWCDPDTSYEEDVQAYVRALVGKAGRLRKAFEDPATNFG